MREVVMATGEDVPRLVVTAPPELSGTVLPLSRPETLIGHSSTADLVLDDSFVSRRHALITIDDAGTATIHDLNSTGGTLVNGEPVDAPRLLRPGDLVSFADLVARFEPASTATASTGPVARPGHEPATTQFSPAEALADPEDRAAQPRTGPPVPAGDVDAAGAGAPRMPAAPVGAAVGPTLAELEPVLGTDASQLIATLAGRGITTLAQVRQAGSLSSVAAAEGQADAAVLIEQHADLARLSPNVKANAAIIAAGFASTLVIAGAPRAAFVTAAAPAVGETAAITMHYQAVAMYNALDQLLAGARIDAATTAGTTGYSDTVNAAISPDDLKRCSCDDCQSLVSPTAYLADLLNYASTHLLTYGGQVGLPYLTDEFFQPFGDLPTDCAAVQTLVRQARVCSEVLRGYLAANPPAAAQAAALQTAQAAYLLAAYQALLTGLGTSLDEVRLATIADPATRSALANRLGLTIDPYGAGRPDVLDRLLLAVATAVPAPPPAQVLTEASIEWLFGLADTTRNPLSDGQVLDDPARVVARWNLDGVSWGQNTDPDGTIYLSVTQPDPADVNVSLFADPQQTKLVGFGGQSIAGVGLPVTVNIASPGTTGVSGAIEISALATPQPVSLGAVPLLTSWQLAALRAGWQAEDHPADAYTAGTTVTPLAALPAGIAIPAALQNEVSYDDTAKILRCTGVMAPADLAQLLGPATGNPAAAAYVTAVTTLYVTSQRSPVIDPDVIGPDDFRVPVPKAAAADPDQPFDLWLRRRQWVDAQLKALGLITEPAPGGGVRPSFTGMLGWMYDPLTYQGTTAAPWSQTTQVNQLQSLWQNLAQGVTVPAITLQLASDLCLAPDAFNRLMALWLQDQASAAEPAGPALTADNWSTVASLLTQAAKTRFYAAWRAEEQALPLDFGAAPFIVSLHEPRPGDWPPTPPAGTPYIDPTFLPLTGLPQPITGAAAVPLWAAAPQAWTARQAQEAALTANLRATNEAPGGGFQAMIQQALGDPAAGDPLPVDIDTLAQQLASTDPAFVAAATTAISAKLFLTVGQFQTMMRLRVMAADPNPANHPTPAQWLSLYQVLTAAETRKRLYPQWVTDEQNAGITYWNALAARLPPWRARADQRSQWHAALAQRSAAPIIDPDLIGPADMVNPVTGDPAFGLWTQRASTVAGLVTAPGAFPASLAGLDPTIAAATGVRSQDLTGLATQAAQGSDITSRLAQLTLSYAAFTQLTTVISLVGGNLTPLDTEQSAFYAILTEVAKQRLFSQWRQQEASAGIIAGPDEFVLQPAGASAPFAPWRAAASDRQAWETTLQARVEQHGTVQAAAAANTDTVEGATLPQLRDALVLATGATGAVLADQADWITQNLLIDAATGGAVKTTRIEQAIETLQELMTGLRAGQLGSFELELASAPGATSFIFGSDRYDVFAAGPDQALWHKYWDGSWSEWENLGGTLASAPAVTSQAPASVDVLALFADDAVWHLSYSDGAWGSWESLGGPFRQGPAAGSPEIGSIDVFAVGTDNQLWQLSGTGGTWAAWQQAARAAPLPTGGIASAPSVTGTGGSYDMFVTGGDSALWHTGYNGAWAGWQSLGGTLTSAPSATSVNGPLQVVARSTDDAIWSLTTQPAGGWAGSQWTSLGGYASQGPGALAVNNIFAAGAEGALEHKWLAAGSWNGWQTTTALSLDAPAFDAEWTWMGSYATWRAAILVFLYPENILDPALRDQKTPGFQTLIQSVQDTASLTAAQAQQLACTYDGYFRDVCSIGVQASCTVWSRLDDGGSCTATPAVQRGWLLDMFGIAANSNTAYWSSYNAADTSGYPQTFWNVIPSLQSQPLVTIFGATAFWVSAGQRYVFVFFTTSQSGVDQLYFTRYDPEIRGQDGWEGTNYQPALPPDWTAFTAQLGLQNGEGDAPRVVVTLPDGSMYVRQLDAAGTGWSDVGWVQAGAWQTWTPAVAANVGVQDIEGQTVPHVTVVSRNPDQLDLFWVDDQSGTVQSAYANVQVNDGALAPPFTIDSAFQPDANVSAVARSPDRLDIFADAGGLLSWNWWDASADSGQWHSFQVISTPGAGPASASGAPHVSAVSADGHRLDVFGFVPSPAPPGNIVVWTWRSDAAPADDQWHAWAPVGDVAGHPYGLGTFSPLAAVARDGTHLDLFMIDNTGRVQHNYWDAAANAWQPEWTPVSASFGTGSFVLAAAARGADLIDLIVAGSPPSNAPSEPFWSTGDFTAGQAGTWTGFQPLPDAAGAQSLGGSGYYPVLCRRPGHDDAFGWSTNPPAVWSTSRDDTAAGGAWQPWQRISDSNLIPVPGSAALYDISAVSRTPDRIDLFVPGGTGASPDGSASLYTTYWKDVDWTTTPLQLPPFSPIPVVTATTPLDIPDQPAGDDLQARRGGIQAAFQANLQPAPGFTQGAPASTMSYLQEAYYFVPVYLANQLVQQGQFAAALDWYRTVYNYALPEQLRDIYYGLVLEQNLPAVVSSLPAGWLLDPLNPHAIAATRRDSYSRYTVLQIVQCMLGYADSLFTTDTSESDAQARTWYLSALALLGLDIFSEQGSCDSLLIPVLEIPADPAWQPLLAGLADDLAGIGNPPTLAPLVRQVTAALAGDGAWAAKFAAARGLIASTERAQPATPTIGGVLSAGAARTAVAYSALLSVPAVDAAAIAVSAATAAALHPPATGGWFHLPVADFWFCLPANPVVSSLQARAENCLFELRNGLNIAGQARQLTPYSAPTDTGSGLPAISAGGQLELTGQATLQPTPYPYATLIARAQQLVQTAQNIEAQMLAALQQQDQDLYEELQARQNLTVANATVQLQALTVQQAADSVTLATMQQASAQLQASYWQTLLSSDIGGLEQGAISALQTSRDLQLASAANSLAASVVSAFNPVNWASFGATSASDVSAALSSAAGAFSTQASINNAQASLEQQQDTWQFQYQLAQANTQIAGQQIQIATDQQQVAGQQLVIAQLQASNATDTVNFLANKFTNAALYDWMAGVLQGVYSYFLQQATAVAILAENQLAFERQQVPAGYIKSSYWQPASANLVAAGTPDNTMGLTGAEQLSEDITRLDQYAFSTNQRQLQLITTISLAQLYPVEFEQLRQTGVMNFSTPMTLFDQDYPGHYLRLIQQVSTSVIALIPPGQNINAALSCTGVSQVVIGSGGVFQMVTVRTDPQSIAITTPIAATGVFAADPQAGLLLPFQDLGVATQWQFELPLAGNQFDFSTLADVQIAISYTALADPGYRAQVIRSLDGQVSQERPYSLVNDLPDQWYDLNNPDQTPTPMSVQFQVAATDFPANLSSIEIRQVLLYFAIAAGQTFEVSVSSLQFTEAGSLAAVGGAATTIGGAISTRRGNAPAWIPVIGKSPFGTWQLTLPDTAEVRGWFTSQLITDILFDISYTAATPPWPA
jgi:hypothetical protein